MPTPARVKKNVEAAVSVNTVAPTAASTVSAAASCALVADDPETPNDLRGLTVGFRRELESPGIRENAVVRQEVIQRMQAALSRYV
jgi:hypothetical protein